MHVMLPPRKRQRGFLINPYSFGGGGGGGGGDPHWDAVVALLHFGGTNGSTTFTDDKSMNTWTRTGGATTTISTAQSKFGGSSMLNTSTSRITLTNYHPGFEFANGNFTIEAWIYGTAYSAQNFIYSHYGNIGLSPAYFGVSAAGMLYAGITSTSSTNLCNIADTVALSTNTWYHVALVRNGSNLQIYKDGVSVASGTISAGNALIQTGGAPAIGGWSAASSFGFVGHIDEFRLTKGIARYTSTFSVPTAAFPDTGTAATGDPYYNYVSLLLPLNNASTDFSPRPNTLSQTGSTFTYDSGTKQYGSHSLKGVFAASTGNFLWYTNGPQYYDLYGFDFTMEWWWNYAASPGLANFCPVWIAKRAASQFSYQAAFYNNEVQFYWSTDGTTLSSIAGAWTPSTSTWYHMAVCRVGNTVRFFVDGVEKASGSMTGSVYASTGTGPRLFADASNNCISNGFMDDFRLTIGVGRYASGFTPPAAALPTTHY